MALGTAVQAAAGAAAAVAQASAWQWPTSGQVPASLAVTLLLLLVVSRFWRWLTDRVPAWPLAGLRLGLAAGALALVPVADIGAYVSSETLLLAISGLLLPLPRKQHLAAQGIALLVSLPRMHRLALLQAALPQRGKQCRAFVSGLRYALQVFVPGGSLEVASHPQQLATSCWMQHTWLAVLAGFLLPTAAALVLHWRNVAAWEGSELALVAAMQAAAASRPGGRRRRTIAGSAEPASSDDGVSLSVAAPSSGFELPVSRSESAASTPSIRSGFSLSSVVSAGSGLSLSSGGKSSSSSRGHSSSSGGKSSSSSSALSPRAAQQRWAMIQALRRHPEWLLQPTQSTRLHWLLLGVPLAAAVWAVLEVAAQGY